MNGILQRKGNIWYAVIDMRDGNKGKQKWISTKCKNKVDAKKVLRDILNKMESDSYVDTNKIVFINCFEEWLNDVISQQVESTTLASYKVILNAHLKKYFDETNLLQQLKTLEFQKYIDIKAKSGRADGRGGLSGQTLRKHKILLQSFFQYAINMNFVSTNPLEKVMLPKKNKFIAKFYTAEQMEQLLNVVKDTALETPVYITAHYGLRRGEILGLRWEDVDFVNGTISICNTRVRFSKGSLNKVPKTESSRRTLPLIENVSKYLKKLYEEYQQSKSIMGNDFEDNGYVCCWKDGSLYDVSYISHKFKELIDKNHMPSIRFHDLRHSTASYLLKQGFNMKEIQYWLGHADMSTTANIYSHIDVDMKKNVATQMNKLFSNFTSVD